MSNEITVTKTLKCPLETSQRKNERVQEVIETWQSIAERIAEFMPSVGPQHWRAQDTTLSRLVRSEFPDHGLRTHDAYQAAYKVGEAYGSWHSNNHNKAKPEFGDGSYARFCHCGVEVSENNDAFGLKIGLEPYDSEWWRIKTRPYHREHLSRVIDGDASTGSAELHLEDNSLTAHISMSRDISVPEVNDVETVIGVDLGERVIYAAAATNGDEVQEVTMESGDEFRHYRDRLTEKRTRLMAQDDLRGVKKCRDEHRRYTDHMTHVASRRIVDFARSHKPACIALENLTDYRNTANDPIHDWPFAELQTKIAYKAQEEGIAVQSINPELTSQKCNRCGGQHTNRNGASFECFDCRYEVHADVNAAINIASTA